MVASVAMKPPSEANDLLNVPMIRSTSSARPKWWHTPRPPSPNTPMLWASSTITLASYLRARSTMSGRLHTSPSIENTPSVTMSFTRPGSHFCNCFSSEAMSLCLYFSELENDRRRPSIIEAWSCSSHKM